MPPITLNISRIPIANYKSIRHVGDSLGRYTLKDAKILVERSPIATYDAKACTMFSVNNGKRNYVGHLAPELQSKTALEKGLDKTLGEMGNESDNLSGVIVGGWDSKNAQSFELPLFLAEIFDKHGIDFSLICGKPKNSAPENLFSLKNQVTIWSDKFKEMFGKFNTRNATREDVQRALEEHYEVVELSNNMPIKIVDQI